MFLLFSVISASALPSIKGFSAELFADLRGGTVHEELYGNGKQGTYTDKLDSLLEWNYDSALLAGGRVSYKIKNFGLDFSLAATVQASEGIMTDHDYMYNKDGQLEWSRSIHDTKVYIGESFITPYIRIPFSFVEVRPLVSLGGGFKTFEGDKGTAYKGNPDYTSDGRLHSWDDEESAEKKVYGINYSEYSFYSFLVAEFFFDFIEGFKFSVKAALSPFTYHYAKDTHLDKTEEDQTVYESMHFCFFDRFAISAGAYFPLSENKALHFTYTTVTGFSRKGDMYDTWYDSLNNDYTTSRDSKQAGQSFCDTSFTAGRVLYF